MMTRKIFFYLLPFIAIAPLRASGELDSLIVQLEKEMKKREFYDQAKELRISNLKSLLNDEDITLESQYFITNKLINEYEYYSFDSSLYHIEKNLALAKKGNI